MSAPRLHQSLALTLLNRSPLHAWREHPELGGIGRKATAAKDGGSLLDAILFGCAERVAVIDPALYPSKSGGVPAGWTNPAIREARDEARADGRIPVLKDDYAPTEALALDLLARLETRGVKLSGESQVTLDWTNPQHGTPCRGTLDHLILDDYSAIIYDLKRKEDCSPDSIVRSMYDYGYDVQRAAYIEAVEQNYPHLVGRVSFRFLFAECSGDELVDVVIAEPAGTMRALGDARWQRACRLWSECLATGLWPGYSDQVIQIEAKPWQLTEALNGGTDVIEFA